MPPDGARIIADQFITDPVAVAAVLRQGEHAGDGEIANRGEELGIFDLAQQLVLLFGAQGGKTRGLVFRICPVLQFSQAVTQNLQFPFALIAEHGVHEMHGAGFAGAGCVIRWNDTVGDGGEFLRLFAAEELQADAVELILRGAGARGEYRRHAEHDR